MATTFKTVKLCESPSEAGDLPLFNKSTIVPILFVGTYLIVQQIELFGDVVVHTVLPGMAIAME